MQKALVTELRHEPKRAPDSEGPSRVPRIAIIGGGFAGVATAIKLLDTGTRPLRISIIEPRSEIGRGIAYSTRESAHLVNGPAKLFSLYPERPEHFAQFLARFAGEWNWRDPLSPDFVNAFAPRSVFGDYVRAELARAVARAAPLVTLEHVAAGAVDLRRRGGRVEIVLSSGQILAADHVVLAIGAAPSRPELPIDPTVAASARYIADPWNLEAFERVPRSGRVLLVGSGLTMLDALVTLERRGFSGRYTAISRRGLLVHARREVVPLRDFLAEAPLPATALGLLRAARQELARTTHARPDWQALVMAIRPHVPALWQRASEAERARFLRHLRPIWEVSLHRAPPRAAALLERGRAEGWFAHRAGRILALEPAGDGRIAVRLRGRGKTTVETLTVDAVVNCTGVSHDWTRAQSSLIANLLAAGVVRPGPLSFGIDADWQHAVIGRDGVAAQDVSAIGHALRGVRWESGTLPELLQQAIQLGSRLSGQKLLDEASRSAVAAE
jgi:uncharacterized NAD(P)/FAD-binding protein YdhS